MIAQLSAQFHATCKQVELELTALTKTPRAEVVPNLVGTGAMLRRATTLVRQARRISLMGGPPGLDALEPDL